MIKQRKKTGPKPRGLTVNKTVMLTTKTSRELAKVARDFHSEGEVMRQAIEAFILAYNVRLTDNNVTHNGQPEQVAA